MVPARFLLHPHPLAVLLAGWGLLLFPAIASAQNERAFAPIREAVEESPGDHAAIAERCEEFLRMHPTDALAPIARGIQAWNTLMLGKNEEAAELLRPLLDNGETPAAEAARFFARSWMSRMDRDRVRDGLRAYYRHEIGFPSRLEDIANHDKVPPELHPPTRDRFGLAWRYSLTGVGDLPGFANQRYRLESTTLGEYSDFEEALETPAGSKIQLEPVQVLAVAGQPPAVQFRQPGQDGVVLVGLGQQVGGIFLTHVGSDFLIVCDSLHWKILPRP